MTVRAVTLTYELTDLCITSRSCFTDVAESLLDSIAQLHLLCRFADSEEPVSILLYVIESQRELNLSG